MADQSPSPLTGKQVVITRAESQSAGLAAALVGHGAIAVPLPLIQILPPEDFAPLDAALRDLASFDWLLFTSQNAVTAVAGRLQSLGIRVDELMPVLKIGAVGNATSEAAQQSGFRVTHVGQGGTAATLVHELSSELSGKRVLLPRSDRARADLVPRLEKIGAAVTEGVAYRTVNASQIDAASREAVARTDAILFFSPSAVHAFVALQKSAQLERLSENVVVGAIGPITSVALRNAGFCCDFQSSEPSVDEIVATLAVQFEAMNAQSASGVNP